LNSTTRGILKEAKGNLILERYSKGYEQSPIP